MKIIRLFFCILIISISSYAKESGINIGILYDKIFTTKKEAIVASKIWVRYLEERGYKNVTIKYYKNENILIADFLNNKLSTILGTYEMYYKNRFILDNASKRRWIPSLRNKTFEQYYLIKNKDSDISFSNLENKVIYFKDNIGRMWLDSLILSKYKKSIFNVFDDVIEIKKSHKLIFNVFFNKNQLSIVSKKLYEDMLKLNPQIQNKIKIIKKSKKIFISAIGFSNKKINPLYDDVIFDLKNDIKNNGKVKLSRSISIYNFYNISDEELNPLDEFFNEYLDLKRVNK